MKPVFRRVRAASSTIGLVVAFGLMLPSTLGQTDLPIKRPVVTKGDLVVPDCGKPGRGLKRIGWGKYGLHFNVPKREVRILGGKPDVDYVRYIIKPKTGEGFLALWFGGFTLHIEPDRDLLVNSDISTQRSLVSADGGVIGKDSWGQLREGGLWRHAALLHNGGAIYRDASPQDASLFNQIVDSICQVPYPKE